MINKNWFILPIMLTSGLASAEDIWLTVGKDTLHVAEQLEGYALSTSYTGFAASPIAVIKIDDSEQSRFSNLLHAQFNRCPGFMAHNSEQEAIEAQINAQKQTTFIAPPLVAQDVLPNLLASVQEAEITSVIRSLSGFKNRFYNTSHGKQASDWIHNRWQSLAAGRSDVSVEIYNHASWPQNSVILTFKGHTKPDEVVVIGGHLDSTIGNSTGEHSSAPGADDNASGIATFTEVIRVLANNPEFKPDRTLRFIGYAAEEVGLRGSGEIARSYKSRNVDVKGVLQLDMTNYQGSPDDFYFLTDYTNATQNSFLKSLVSKYLPQYRYNETRCGYACSDHASWHQQGYPASMPSESKFGEHNPHIHTPQDTLDKSANAAAHAFKFAQLALAYAVEMTVTEPTENQPPKASFSASAKGLTVTLNQGSSDDKGIERYEWSFGDGTTSSQISPTHTYSSSGNYTISLTVFDAEGQSDNVIQQVTVSDVNCFVAAYPAWSAAASYKAGDKVSYGGKNYEAIWWSTGATPSVYTNVWKLIDDDGSNGSGECDNEAPVASFTLSANGMMVSFQSTSTDDNAIVSYLWNFGDNSQSTQANPSHQYSKEGVFSVSLTVKDDEGLTHTVTQQVEVSKTDTGTCSVSPWDAGTVYLTGTEVAHEGNRYRARWWTQGDNPTESGPWGVWENIGVCQ
ncbi:M20/M25/M40 family metallo-hydrolase [Grimontia marina]|uniref:Bacterial leucyl aminopeptidase n=1 Tax=Grimontia marina TaxID=646534 RepID=A0A128FGU9_9GAMM|nr:M20/M25/M40 family metallo-hydrolase [Grimontia marina]CZF86019.1 Bacterial leucyl aminopeptidase precursor [Grimontia marina]